MSYRLTTLPSGLRIASESLAGVESVSVSVSVDVGARFENDEEGGISHLLEHMAFKGTKRRSARDIAEQFDSIGGQFNAYTSMEHTVYYAKVLKEELPLAVDILADILQHSTFDAAELAREQDVIAQEIAMHHDTPEDWIADLSDAVAFPNQAFGRPILGTETQVAGYTRDDLFAYMRKHYTPNRIVLSAAGNISHDALVALAEQHFTALSGHQPANPDMAQYIGGESRTEDDLEQLHLLISFPAVSVHDADYYAMQLYSHILGGGMSSRLFQEVREKRGLAYHISSAAMGYRDCGMLAIYSATGTEHAAELPLLIADELKKMAANVSETELQRAKNQQKAELLMARESSGTVAGWIGKHLLMFGHYRTLSEIVHAIEAVTLEDIQRAAARILSCRTPTVAGLGPVGTLTAYNDFQKRLAA